MKDYEFGNGASDYATWFYHLGSELERRNSQFMALQFVYSPDF